MLYWQKSMLISSLTTGVGGLMGAWGGAGASGVPLFACLLLLVLVLFVSCCCLFVCMVVCLLLFGPLYFLDQVQPCSDNSTMQ